MTADMYRHSGGRQKGEDAEGDGRLDTVSLGVWLRTMRLSSCRMESYLLRQMVRDSRTVVEL